MLIKALIATLVVSSSVLALTTTADAAPVHGVLTAQHVDCAPTVSAWTMLSANDHLGSRGTEVRVDSWSRYSDLKLVANGRNKIDRVNIRFENGAEQRVKLDDMLDARNPSLTIPLQGGARQIKSIEVLGSAGRQASFEILAA